MANHQKIITVLGARDAGKSSLVQSFIDQPFNALYTATIGVDIRILNEANQLQFRDTSGDEKFENIVDKYIPGSHLLLYCVNLSREVVANDILREIEKISQLAPNAPVILVGTHVDESREDYIAAFQDIQNNERFYHHTMVSSKNKTGVKGLLTIIRTTMFPIEEALNSLENNSLLFDQVQSFEEEISHLPEEKYNFFAQQLVSLVNKLVDFHSDKVAAIHQFEKRCKDYIASQAPLRETIQSAVKVLVATAAVTIIATCIGFGVGFALGAWSGPGAFFSALFTGAAAAVTVVSAAVAIGSAAGALTYHGLFKEQPLLRAVRAVADASRDTFLNNANDDPAFDQALKKWPQDDDFFSSTSFSQAFVVNPNNEPVQDISLQL